MEHYFTNNENLKSELRAIRYLYSGIEFNFVSDLGVFSKDRVDYGSRLLIESYFKHGQKNKRVLDVGCGYGLIGITVSKVMDSNLTMVDVNKRALHLADMNIKDNNVDAKTFESDIYSNVTGKFDVVITNPPIRAGKETVYKFLNGAFDHLNEKGELWFVMKKEHGVKSAIKMLETNYNVNIIEKDKGFFVIKVTKNLLT